VIYGSVTMVYYYNAHNSDNIHRPVLIKEKAMDNVAYYDSSNKIKEQIQIPFVNLLGGVRQSNWFVGHYLAYFTIPR
jgi:hypothetical protein